MELGDKAEHSVDNGMVEQRGSSGVMGFGARPRWRGHRVLWTRCPRSWSRGTSVEQGWLARTMVNVIGRTP